MPALLIKDLPAEVHKWLKREAEANRRSMTQQVVPPRAFWGAGEDARALDL
ncbi:MAG: hypothetical protein NTV79_01415 [Candidatus Aureabacteria bacterium]|nr:hypothetical protein [Candidatus Auribacterota bacterium]